MCDRKLDEYRSCTTSCALPGPRDAAAARAAAVKLGWSCVRDEHTGRVRDQCPQCNAQTVAAEQETVDTAQARPSPQ